MKPEKGPQKFPVIKWEAKCRNNYEKVYVDLLASFLDGDCARSSKVTMVKREKEY